MSAIITHNFRVNNVQHLLDDMTVPTLTITGVSAASGAFTISGLSTTSTQRIVPGMMVVPSSGGTYLTASSRIIVSTVSSTSIGLSSALPVTLSSATIDFLNAYYIGIGKGDFYSGGLQGTDTGTPGTPFPMLRDCTDVKNNLNCLQPVIAYKDTDNNVKGNAGFVVPNYAWSANNYYKAWDPSDPTCFHSTQSIDSGGSNITLYPCFVTYNNAIYICVASGADAATKLASIANPSATSTNGYVWKSVGVTGAESVSAENVYNITGYNTYALPLDSNRYIKIKGQNSIDTDTTGKIFSIRIVDGGSGYTISDTFIVDGDGTTVCTGSVSAVTSGRITGLTVSNNGSTYTTGTIRFTSGSGTGAILIPRITPLNGFSYSPSTSLPGWFAGMQSNFFYNSGYPGTGDTAPNSKIRQISIIRNPVVSTSTASSNSSLTYRCLKKITFSSASSLTTFGGSTTVAAGNIIELGIGSTWYRAWVDHVDTANNTIYFHQNSTGFMFNNSNTVFSMSLKFPSSGNVNSGIWKIFRSPSIDGVFPTSDVLTLSTTTGTYTVSAADEYVAGTGEVIFIENRLPITQASGQAETITAVVQF